MNRVVSGLMLAWLALLTVSAEAAELDTKAIQDEIDQSVWRTFQRAFADLDGEALNTVYANTVLRVTPEGGLDTQSRFKQTNRTRFAANIANGDQIALDFWFDSRHTNRTTSYEVGFYRLGITNAAGHVEHFYGQFHIVLSKIEGRWQIVQDWDTDTIGGRAISASDFAQRSPARF
ncbi:MAG: hypothetical protein AAF529_17075 [Pseudomonadota bacterium]